MVLSKHAIKRSRAAWSFAHTVLVDELAKRELDSPEIVEAIWDIFAMLDEEFGAEAEKPTDERTEEIRRACEDSSTNLAEYIRLARYAEPPKGAKSDRV